MVVLRSALMATTAVLAPPPFDERAVAAQLRDDGITVASLVPAQLQRLLDAGATAGPALRRILLGGGRCRAPCWPAPATPACPSARATASRRPARPVTVAEPGDLETAGAPDPRRGDRGHRRGRILVSGGTVNSLGSLRTGDLGRIEGRRAGSW